MQSPLLRRLNSSQRTVYFTVAEPGLAKLHEAVFFLQLNAMQFLYTKVDLILNIVPENL